MKKVTISLLILLFAGTAMSQGVAINEDNAAPDPSAMLDVQSTDKGMLVPRMTQSERDAIPNPANGLLIYQTNNTPGFYYNAGTPGTPDWRIVGNNAGTFSQWTNNGSDIYYDNGYVGIGLNNPQHPLHILATMKAGEGIFGTMPSNLLGLGPDLYGGETGLFDIQADKLIAGKDYSTGVYQYGGTPLTAEGLFISSGNVGIGSNSPSALLHTYGISSGDGNVLFEGAFKTSGFGNPPAEGAGTRLMWYPDKASFRAGRVTGTHWDAAQIGNYSFATGYNSRASGTYSSSWGFASEASGLTSTAWGYQANAAGSYSTSWGFNASAEGGTSTAWGSQTNAEGSRSTAWGRLSVASGTHSTVWGESTEATANRSTAWGNGASATGISSTAWGDGTTSSNDQATAWGQGTEASGNQSTAWGSNTDASGSQSTAWGNGSAASGLRSTAFGWQAEASGQNATAFGANTTAPSYVETVIGRYNTTYTPNSETGWSSGDRLFVVGNGSSASNPSDALVVLKNGRVGIGTSNPADNLTVQTRIRSENSDGELRTIINTTGGGAAGFIQTYGPSGNSNVRISTHSSSTDHGSISVRDANGNNKAWMYVDGNSIGWVRADRVRIVGGSDLAENFDIISPQLAPLPGMVVSIDPGNAGKLRLSDKPYDNKVAGIISGANGVESGMVMGQTGTIADGEYPVSLTGRVYVYASDEGGEILPGDMLTTSSRPGYAKKVSDKQQAFGAIIGKAMTDVNENGFVLVLVNLQ